jgi:hypothetical protein
MAAQKEDDRTVKSFSWGGWPGKGGRMNMRRIGRVAAASFVASSTILSLMPQRASAVSNSYGTIRPMHANKCIDEPWQNSNPTTAYIYSCHYGDNQMW